MAAIEKKRKMLVRHCTFCEHFSKCTFEVNIMFLSFSSVQWLPKYHIRCGQFLVPGIKVKLYRIEMMTTAVGRFCVVIVSSERPPPCLFSKAITTSF